MKNNNSATLVLAATDDFLNTAYGVELDWVPKYEPLSQVRPILKLEAFNDENSFDMQDEEIETSDNEEDNKNVFVRRRSCLIY